MPDTFDFERYWLIKLDQSLTQRATPQVRQQVMAGSAELDKDSPAETVIAWTHQALVKLESLVEPAAARAVLTDCACHTSHASLQAARQAYSDSGEVDQALAVLQRQFETMLREILKLEEPLVQEIARRGWGMAGQHRGDTIIATKIPKSGYLKDYFRETDPQKKRALYCHCPRVREALQAKQQLPALYCYCGAGFYQDIWQTILDRPVQVELLASVMQGDNYCQVAVHLAPAGAPEGEASNATR